MAPNCTILARKNIRSIISEIKTRRMRLYMMPSEIKGDILYEKSSGKDVC